MKKQLSVKKISLVIIFLLFFINLCFAIEVDKKIHYRVYVGKDKRIDWIDISRVGWINSEGNFITDFEDLSPILKIYEAEDCFKIIKTYSLWTLYKTKDFPYFYLQLEVKNINYKNFIDYSEKGFKLVYWRFLPNSLVDNNDGTVSLK